MITLENPSHTKIVRQDHTFRIPYPGTRAGTEYCSLGEPGIRGKWTSFVLFLLIGVVSLGGCSMKKPTLFWTEDEDYQSIMTRQKAGIAPDHKEIIPAVTPDLSQEEYEKLGDSNARQGEVRLAAVHYEKALEIEPSSVPTRHKVAMLYLNKGKPERAYDRFHEILEYDFDYAPAYVGMGQSLLKMGKDAEAELEFRQALVLKPQQWGVHNYLGIIYDRRYDHMNAIDQYKKALTLKPSDPSLLNNLGMAHFFNKQYEEAAQMFQQVVQTGSKNPKIWNNLGLTYAKLGRYTESYDAFQQGLDPAKAYNNLGVVFLEKGETARAMQCFEEAVKAQPTYYEKAHENLQLAKRVLSRLPSIQQRVARQRGGNCL